MAYNKQYNSRFSSRYNTTGQFVPAEQLVSNTSAAGGYYTPRLTAPVTAYSTSFNEQSSYNSMSQNMQSTQNQDDDVNMEADTNATTQSEDSGTKRPHWMKSKKSGVKKVPNREKKRRRNENLRRLLTPKNALMVLNEMMPNEQVANQFKVEPASSTEYGGDFKTNSPSFRADLTLEGTTYEGFGENKLIARNAAAEKAIRDLIIKKLNKSNADSDSVNDGDTQDEEALPMIQLASFALHKLFSEWEYEGHKVPQLKPVAAESESKKVKELPANAASMHPCMLLTYMRPHLEYRELDPEGDKPQNMVFTMALDVDGETYTGRAANKKEARKAVAKAVCEALFHVTFDAAPAAASK